MRRTMNKKGLMDEILDDLYALLFLFLAFLIAFLSFTIGQKHTLIEYKTSLGEVNNERTLNLYFKQPLEEDLQLADFINYEETAKKIIPLTAKPYFDDYFGRLNWWVIEITFPNKERENIKVTSSSSPSIQRTAATLVLPSTTGIVNVVLFEDKHVDVVLMATRSPLLALYYAISG